jgi:hypothetical protein
MRAAVVSNARLSNGLRFWNINEQAGKQGRERGMELASNVLEPVP